jgi:uroporphyrinogen-III synthase
VENKFKVVITRPEQQALELKRLLDTEGVEGIIVPLIRIDKDLDWSARKSFEILLTEELKNYDGIIVTSPNSVVNLKELCLNSNLLKSLKFIILQGEKTRVIWELCFGDSNNVLIPKVPTAEGIVKLLDSINGLNKRWIFFSPKKGLDTIPKAISQLGGRINQISLYQTRIKKLSREELDSLKEYAKTSKILFTFFSPSAVKSFSKNGLFSWANNSNVYFATFGETTARELKQFSREPDLLPSKPDITLFIEEIVKFVS